MILFLTLVSFLHWTSSASELVIEKPGAQLCQSLDNLRNNIRLLFTIEKDIKQKLNTKSLNHLKRVCKDQENLSPNLWEKISSEAKWMYCQVRIEKYQNWGVLLLGEYTNLIRTYRSFLEKNKDQLSPIPFGLLFDLDNEDPESTIPMSDDITELSEIARDSYLFLNKRLLELRGISVSNIRSYTLVSSLLRERMANKHSKSHTDYLELSSEFLIDDTPLDFYFLEHPFIEELDMFSRTMCH